MKARQNPFSKFESLMQRIVEVPFALMFPSKLEPAEVSRKLERAMEDNLLLQSEGRRLAPNIYDVYLSIKDHQQLSAGQMTLVRDWQSNLVESARQQRYTLKTMPIIRLHGDSSLRPGMTHIVAELVDRQHMGGEGGAMATQAMSAEQLAQLRAQLVGGQQGSAANLSGAPGAMPSASNASVASVAAPPMPQSWLAIRVSQGGQHVYRIEKPIVNIGRQLSNDIIVEDKRVSRYHAQIKYQSDGQFALFDLGSTNGITINGVPHMRQHILRQGDRFTIGSYDFHFERR